MPADDKVNILLVDDQPGKLLSYETILAGLHENLLKANSGREALEHLLKNDIAVILVDVCMPDLDGFQLAAMIREHPRFQKTAIIFISAIFLSELDSLRGYEMGAVDYVPVPVVPEVLRAKVKVFAELYRKTRQLETLNSELEERVAARTAELERSTEKLMESEKRRSLALSAGQMGSWEWNCESGHFTWDDGQFRIFGVDPENFLPTTENFRALIHADDREAVQNLLNRISSGGQSQQFEFRIRRPNGRIRWCLMSAAATTDESRQHRRVSGVIFDITDRKDAEEKQTLLAREVDHRAKNALALVQSILRLTRADDMPSYISSVEGRVQALSRAHNILSQARWHGAWLRGLIEEELAPYRVSDKIALDGPEIVLQPQAAQTLALAIHELSTNAAKYGALSTHSGRLAVNWEVDGDDLVLEWRETGGPTITAPTKTGFGTKILFASVEKQLRGTVAIDWRPSGLVCRIAISARNSIEAGERPQLKFDAADTSPHIVLTGTKVLVVEDEALVALAINDALVDLGLTVLGPYSRVSEARATLDKAAVDAAILDVNVAGELVYPLARVLKERGIPFIFITGYSEEAIAPHFDNVPVLQKPIQRNALESIFRDAARNGASARQIA